MKQKGEIKSRVFNLKLYLQQDKEHLKEHIGEHR